MAVTITVITRCQAETRKGDQCSREATAYEGKALGYGRFEETVTLVDMIEQGRNPRDYRYGLGFPSSEFYCSLHAVSGRGYFARV